MFSILGPMRKEQLRKDLGCSKSPPGHSVVFGGLGVSLSNTVEKLWIDLHAMFRIVQIQYIPRNMHTVFALLCFVVVIHWLIFPYPSGLLHWHYPSASKATLMNMDKYFMWIHYERLHNHNKAKHNKTVCTFLGIYCVGQEALQDTSF